ncbi:MAG: hypothetical protein QOE28_2660 [Solirubrobacteraceae bacterium]|nr:hypothetical protein [Solirubrobacteraceae bacterium]
MRSILTGFLLIAAVAAVGYYFLSGPGKGPDNPHYTVELDNAFGVVAGADMKVAGVRAGKVKKLRVDLKNHKALVDFEISQQGFGSLRKDVTCESRPQSLIGEYYIDCNPGKSPQKLPIGATIPVSQTTSTIPIDLVNNVLRQPYRERLGLILDELGVGVAGRAQDIQDTVRRASPALRETDKVLAKLATQNQTLKQLVTNADTVLGDLAANKKNVGRWVDETKHTAQVSAERRADIAAGLHRFPTFLAELKPTMASLGAAADANRPSLENLNASAGQLTTFLTNLKPFSQATQVNMRSLAATARKGRPAVKAAQPVIQQLTAATQHLPELANNAAIVFEHLNDRKHAVEKDPRSPGGQGYTGFEAILQWLFDQSQAINIYDKNGYMLKVDLFASKCSDYQNPQSLKDKLKTDPNFYKDCAAILGPNQPGITQADPTATGTQFASTSTKSASAKSKKKRTKSDRKRQAQKKAADLKAQAKKKLRDALGQTPAVEKELEKKLQDQLGIDLPNVPGVPQTPAPSSAPSVPSVPQSGANSAANPLLDYLLSP